MTSLVLALGLLSTVAISHAEPADRFAVAGMTEAQVRTVFDALQAAVTADDADAVSRVVIYPLTVNGPRRKGRHIRSRRAFLAEYQDLFDAKHRAVVRRQRFEDLFANWQGVMLGDGELWIGGICERVIKPFKCVNPRFGVIVINQTSD
jgi:hypothetical protein